MGVSLNNRACDVVASSTSTVPTVPTTINVSSNEMEPSSARSQLNETDVDTTLTDAVTSTSNEPPKPTTTAPSSGRSFKTTKKATVTKHQRETKKKKKIMTEQLTYRVSPVERSQSISSSTSLNSSSTSFDIAIPVHGQIGNSSNSSSISSSNTVNNSSSNNNNIPRRLSGRVGLMKHLLTEMRIAESECWNDDEDDSLWTIKQATHG